MKTTTTLLLVGGLAYLGYRAKQAAEAVVAPAPLPPPNSGPVVNGLSFYQLEGLSGFGSSFKKAVKKGTKAVSKISPSAAIIKKVTNTDTPGDLLKKIDPVKNLHKSPVFSKTMLVRKLRPRGRPQDNTPAQPGQEIVYQDVKGNTITEAEWNALTTAVSSNTPIAVGGKWALPSGILTAENPNKPAHQSPPFVPAGPIKPWNYPRPSINQGASPVYNPQPNEELVINSSYSDDYGLPSAGTQHTAPSAGAPALPGGITTEVSTPAAQEAAPEAPPVSNTGKLLVGTALAAGAAYLAFT